uniref:Mab-21 n=1 Tax=Daphnia magna TaxID=35525 RepID=A0A0P5PZF4_9CRUS
MGNNCCQGQSELADGFEVERRMGSQGNVQSSVAMTFQDNGKRIDPRHKVNEYYQILREIQTENLNKMRDQLKKNPQLFLLNNLILSIQFFDNFDRDKESIRSTKTDQETAVNSALGDIRRGCHYEGALTEVVGRDYRYQPKGANLPEVVTKTRYNIIHRNLEVYPQEQYSSLVCNEYTSADDPIYRFCMEDVEKLPGWIMLRCVDIPNGHRSSDGTHSTTYDRVDNDSESYYGKSSDYDSPKSSVQCDSIPSVKSGSSGTTHVKILASQEISKRPPMATPDVSSSSSTDDDGGDQFPSTGTELMKVIENRMKGRDNRPPASAVPLSDDFGRARAQKPAVMVPTLPAKVKTKRRGVKSIESSSDDDYDYTSINDLPRPLDGSKLGLTGQVPKPRNSALSSDCFQTVKIRVVDSADNPLGLGGQFERKTYLSSTAFFGQFAENFYDWSQKLDRGLQDASSYKAAICCTLIKPASNCQYRTTVEFLPVIPVAQWPDAAREWQNRKRTAMLDKRTNIQYRWPQPTQVDTIVKQGCHLSTEGGKFRGRTSPNSKLEWQFSFGTAQDTLLSSLSEPHLRALLWARLIFHHVIAPIGVLSQYHMETVFFWLVESNYIDWNEASLGENIMNIFQTLYNCIQQRKLQHYFIRKRNLFSSKAPKDLVKAQGRLFRLIEKFVPLTMQAAKQFQTSNSTFPFPDLTRLWEIVTTPLTLVSINPGLAGSNKHLSNSDNSLNGVKKKRGSKGKSSDEGFWEAVTKAPQPTGDKTRDLLRKERARIDAEEREKRQVPVAEAADKADVNITAFNISQTKILLEFFCEHFIRMSASCNKIRAYNKSTVMLDQAFNLATLLKEERFDESAEDFFDIIEKLRSAAHQGQFTEPVVNIPGSPCVFQTGIEAPVGRPLSNGGGIYRNSSLSNGAIRLTPLPLTPTQQPFRFNKANGHVIQKSTLSYEQDFLNGPMIHSMSQTIEKPSSNGAANVTSAVIESVRSSETEPTDQFDSPPPTHRKFNKIIAFSQSDDDMDESTDF